jgi:pilus assembly protein Flp/PilA
MSHIYRALMRTGVLTIASISPRPPMLRLLMKLLNDDTGATAIEYGLIAALISLAAISMITNVGKNLSTTFNTVATKL